MTTQAERFEIVLADQVIRLFKTAKYAYMSQKNTPEAFAKQMTAALANGCADKSGDAVRATCTALGVKHTYKAIEAFLSNQPKPT
jgi:hypothetical protein